MNILAIETSTRVGSVSLHREATLVESRELPPDERTAQCLIPQVDQLLRVNQLSPGDVELVAVSLGPGSFTGLRIGVTLAKTLAYGVEAAIVGVPTGEAIALRATQSEASIPIGAGVEVLIDAQRKQLFSQFFELSSDHKPIARGDWRLVSRQDWLRLDQERDDSAWVTGPGLMQVAKELDRSVDENRLEEVLGPSVPRVVPPPLWQPDAQQVGQLGWDRAQANRLDSVWGVQPDYGRRSAAEEKADAQAKSSKQGES